MLLNTIAKLISKYTYRAFGLIIESDIDCPELIPSSEIPNVIIAIGKVPNVLKNPLFSGVRFQTNGQEFLLAVDKIAKYYVTNGNSIIIEPFTKADPASIRLFLLGSAIGALIHQRRLVPFHGSAIKINDKAIILSGLSGAGKSTLAAAFKQKGYKILADDISVISFTSNEIPYVNPGFPQMKLWSDSIQKLGEDPKNYSKIREELNKYRLPIDTGFCNESLPLQNIFIINSSNLGELKIEQIRGIEKFSMLKTHTYRFNFVTGKEMQSTHFKSFEKISKTIEIYRLTRPSGKFPFDELIDLILHANG